VRVTPLPTLDDLAADPAKAAALSLEAAPGGGASGGSADAGAAAASSVTPRSPRRTRSGWPRRSSPSRAT
jgi:hypothetical protein